MNEVKCLNIAGRYRNLVDIATGDPTFVANIHQVMSPAQRQ